jgi:hypothetical protein
VLGIVFVFSGLARKKNKASTRRRQRKAAGGTEKERDKLRADNLDLRHDLDEQRDELARSKETHSLVPQGDGGSTASQIRRE